MNPAQVIQTTIVNRSMSLADVRISPKTKRGWIYLLSLVIFSCNSSPSWQVYIKGVGTYSSPRMVDLNNDGTLDIIIGAGAKEEKHSDTAVLALDGRVGKLLWRLSGENQFTGSAVFADINNDKISDVVIGGRWAELAAINGADGTVLWRFFSQRTKPNPSDAGWYNFSTPQFIPDQDNDGVTDILITNGGNAMAAASDTNRPSGKLLVLSSRTGKILSEVKVPDGKETYMSVVCSDEDVRKNVDVLFGTGGESIGGHLYRTTLNDIMKGDISKAKILATGEHKGFISSPVYVNINNDSIYDIIINKVEGEMLAIDGATDSIIWKLYFPGTEAYTNPAIGYFTDDSIPDVFCNYAIGVFPDLRRSIRFMADGRNGNILYRDTVKAFQYASAVVADINGDGHDDVLVDQSEGKRKQFEEVYYSYLYVFDFKNNNRYVMGDTVQATNFASTPWIGDMDGDNKLDIVHAEVNYKNIRFDLEQPLGLFVSIYKTGTIISKRVKWGAYMGSEYRNIFR